MANIASTDVTYTILAQMKEERGKKMNIVKVAFGNGALTYPAGGVPILKASLGLPTNIEAIIPFGSDTAFSYEYDLVNSKLKTFQSATHTHDLFLKNADQADGATTAVNAATDKLGANTGSNISVTGLAAGATTHGGVQGVAAAALTEPSAVAIAAQNVYVLAIGW